MRQATFEAFRMGVMLLAVAPSPGLTIATTGGCWAVMLTLTVRTGAQVQ